MRPLPALWAALAVLTPLSAYGQTPPQPPDQPPVAPVAPVATPPAVQPIAPVARARSWFDCPPVALTLGPVEGPCSAQIYGFVEVDAMNDSTRAYADSLGNSLIPKDVTWAGTHGRTQFTMRNTRLGIKLNGPVIGGVKSSALLEVDFFASPGSYDSASSGSSSAAGATPALSAGSSLSETSFYANAVPRVRHAYLRIDTDLVSVLAGQTYNLMGWQPYFFPAAMEFFGLPAMAFNRTTQVRVMRTFNAGPVDVDVAIAGLRPPQRDASVPSGEAGALVKLNRWKGLRTVGAAVTTADPLAIGVSGAVRRFAVDSYGAPPTSQARDTGWGISIDALVPILPVQDADHRSNALTLTGSFTVGSGDADVLGGVTTGITNPPLLILPPATGAAIYNPDVDSGLAVFTPDGTLHTIAWRTAMVGLQYYLPPSGRLFVSSNFTQGDATNAMSLAAVVARQATIITQTRYVDANVFFDIAPNARTGVSYQLTTQTYGDGQQPRNQRWFGGLWYFF